MKVVIRIFLFVLLALLSSYEEIMQLIERGSWHLGMTWLPIWNTQWDGFWKLFDSHHFVFGLFVLAFATVLRMQPKDFFYWESRLITDAIHIGILLVGFLLHQEFRDAHHLYES